MPEQKNQIAFFLIDSTYLEVEQKTVVQLYGVTPEREQIVILDDSFNPYFWVIPKTNDVKKLAKAIIKLAIREREDNITVTDVRIEKKKLAIEEVDPLKVIVSRPTELACGRAESNTWPDKN